MKPPLFIFAAVLGFAGGFLGAQLALSGAPSAPARVVAPELWPGGGNGGGSAELAGIEAGLDGQQFPLRQVEGPDPRAAEALEEEPPAPVTPGEPAGIPPGRDRERERLKHEAAAAREKRVQDEVHRRATLVADELGLPTGSEQKIARVFLAERDKLAAVREEYRQGVRTGNSRKLFREGLTEVRDWRNAELQTLFGEDVARKVAKAADRSWGKTREE